ncbi:YybH family protein [Ulvibacterium sp.]|uniref:YybH family protein n=1 Tax=Ulvibacterium sp. TaxID=2665914 RepID=UPI003CC5AD04
MSQEKQQIIDILQQYQKSTNTADAGLAASLYKEDAIMIPANFPTNFGKEAIFRFYDYAFSLLQLTLEFDIKEDQIQVNGDFAYATTTSVGTRLIRETGVVVPEDNRELWLFEHIMGEWKIAGYMFNIPPTKES